LAADGQDEDGVDGGGVAVEGEVGLGAGADEEFAKACGEGAPDEGAVGQDVDGADDLGDVGGAVGGLVLGEVIEDALEVGEDFGGEAVGDRW